MKHLTPKEIADKTDHKNGLANIRAINKLFRAQDDSYLYPIYDKFNATERAIKKIRKQGYALAGLEYCFALETEITEIVNNFI